MKHRTLLVSVLGVIVFSSVMPTQVFAGRYDGLAAIFGRAAKGQTKAIQPIKKYNTPAPEYNLSGGPLKGPSTVSNGSYNSPPKPKGLSENFNNASTRPKNN